MREVTVDSIRVSLHNYQRVVVLKEKDSDRVLPIWIGPQEAEALAIHLQQVTTPRPLTHDLLRSVIQSLGAEIKAVVVNDLANDTFYARIILDVSGRHVEVDSRPSDAINLAVRAQVPIYVEDEVLDKAGIVLDRETGKVVEPAEQGPGLSKEEMERLRPFREFIESLNLEDLGGGNPARE